MDKTTIVGQDGQGKYELTPDNEVINLQDACECSTDKQTSSDGKHCKTCKCYIKKV
jgi:hypothetical protein